MISDLNNPEGWQYPHDLRKPLPLIPNSQVTKTKAADYGHVKWIEDLVPNTMWSPVRHIIIAVTKLQIVEWHNYKHLDWITVLQGKLTNLTIEERLALNVSLRMFTRSIVIQRRVEDLQLGVESYQKKLNLTRPDTYRSNLKRLPTYSAYPNPRGFIYQNKDKKNKLMRIDELHKFSDGTLNDVRTALDDILKRIGMKYLPQTYWKKVDKDRVGAMIQAIDKQLKNRRIMRSLEKFVESGKLPTEMELVLEQTQQGTSYEVLVSAEVVEELQRIVRIKGEKKEALHTLRQKPEHAEFDESDTHVLERFDTSAGNHVMEILPKLKSTDHRSILMDSKIQIVKEDEYKTTFHTPKGIYYYKEMPFGLKNAGATYQRLVDKVFASQIRRNMEAYADDMVIKSMDEEDMLLDIKETFERIKASPTKVQDITNLKQPKTIKEVQILNGKLTTLNRFLGKSAEKALPFFKTLKGCIKKKDLVWTKEADKAFEEMKKHIRKLPTLKAPK
ncbi:reverse transcriptase domain-containing protein, partial [Tanacetum coccineum]